MGWGQRRPESVPPNTCQLQIATGTKLVLCDRTQKMSSLLPQFIEDLDQGLGVCSLEDFVFIEWNTVMGKWMNLPETPYDADTKIPTLLDNFTEQELKRFKKSVEKKRKFRFKRTLPGAQKEEVAYNTKVLTDRSGKLYLFIQGCVDHSAREAQKMEAFKKSYDQILLERDRATAASEAKTQFLATMSHELRTPMNSILGIAQQMRKTHLQEEQTQYLETIQSSGKQLLSIINEILDFSKIESGKVELHPESTNLSQLTTEVFEMCGYDTHRSSETKLTLENDTSNLPCVMVDRTRIRQVLINLLSNAIKFTRQGSVTLRASGKFNEATQSCDLIFHVLDTGIGIAEDRIESLFDPFIQADGSTTRQFGGTGLGLSISLQLIELMGGTINVTSELQKGSCFSVTLSLPISEKPAQLHNSDAQFETRLGDSLEDIKLCGKNIMVIDDTPINCDLVGMALDEYDLNLVVAHNGREAIEAFEKETQFDLILMDCLMPVMDGFDAAKKIREIESNRPKSAYNTSVPIIALTASASDAISKKCRESGMDDVMLKPFDFHDLIKRVDFWCRRPGMFG